MDTLPAQEPSKPRSPPTGSASTLQVLLGLFIVWQMIFLIAGNLIALVQDARPTLASPEDGPAAIQKVAEVVDWLAPGWAKKEGHVHDAEEVVGGLTRRWGQVTGQVQGWSLFAPAVSHDNAFVAVELCWDDGSLAPELLLSDNEPHDPNSFVRVGGFRLRKYEAHLDVVLALQDKETTEAEAAERWRRRIEDKLNTEGHEILAFLQWRWRQYRQAHPDRPTPSQVILHVRRYSIPPPEQVPWRWNRDNYQMFDTQPLSRWQPGEDWGPEYGPLEMYNPETRAFEKRRQK